MIANLLQEFAAPLSSEQVNKVKDALGDLSLEQVNWLSGYLAGLAATGAAVGLKDVSEVVGQAQTLTNAQSNAAQALGAAEASQPSVNPKAATNKLSTILFGSQTGNARGVAESLYQQLQSANIEARLVDMAEYNPKQLKKEQRVFIVVSTHGEGEPPDDALELHEFIHSKKAPDLNGKEFAVLSLGDSSYEYFCKTGQDFDQTLVSLGATRLFERVDCDVDYQQASTEWAESVLALVKQSSESAASDTHTEVTHTEVTQTEAKQTGNSQKGITPNQDDESNRPHLSVVTPDVTGSSANASAVTSFNKFNPYTAEILDVISITARGSSKPTFHVEIDLEDSGIQYQPGDALGVWPVNQSTLVNETLSLLSFTGEELVTVEQQTKSLKDALTQDFELTQVSPSFIKWLAEQTKDDQLTQAATDKSLLNGLLANSQVPELLQSFNISVTAEDFVAQLRRITPRLYSIASSQQEVEEEVHLTVGLVSEQRNNTSRNGAASQLLSEFSTGDTARVFVEPNKHFKLPDDSNQKIIMIGAGTGIAPYRGFIQQRAAQSAKGQSWLIFGNPNFATDFLYQIEWQQYLKKQQLSQIDLAFSRDQEEKVYVQHKLLEHSKQFNQWLQQGAHIYLCGDKDRIGKSVEQTILQIIASEQQCSDEQAKQILTDLKREGRYQKDVY